MCKVQYMDIYIIALYKQFQPSQCMKNTKVLTKIILILFSFALTIWGLSSWEITIRKQQRCLINSLITYWNNPFLQRLDYNICMTSEGPIK